MQRQLSSQAAAAKQIRQILKNAFPSTKFRVRSSGYSMGDSVDVDWTDGPTRDQVNKLVGHYQYGHFNGMEDIYEYSNSRKDIPQTKFLMLQRDISEQTYLECFEYIKKHFVNCDHLESVHKADQKLMEYWHVWTAANLINRSLCNFDLSNGVDVEAIFKC